MTADAAKTLLRIAGEQTEVSDNRLAEPLTKIANDYKRLQTQVAALNTEESHSSRTCRARQSGSTRGHFGNARNLLRQAAHAQLAAANEARKLDRQGN